MRSNAASIEDIKNYLREVEFKKVLFGGCDREDVLEKLHTVTLMFRELIAEQEDRLCAALTETDRVKAQAAAERQENARRSAQEAQAARAAQTAPENEERFHPQADEMVRLEPDRAEVIKRAENEARKIIFQADERAREMLRAREWEIDRMLSEKHGILEGMSAEIEHLKEERRIYIRDLRVTMRLLNEDFAQMQIKAQSLIKKTDDYGGESPCAVPEIILR